MVQGKSEFDNQLEEIGKERYINDMELREPKIYGIGNPLIDIIVNISEDGLNKLGIYKGAMHLIDEKRRALLLEHIESLPRTLLCGGSCPNTIITLASLGLYATLAGKVGNDEFGTIYRKRLKELKVHDELVHCDEPTGSSIILITEDSERTMNTYLGANRLFNKNDIVVKTLRNATYFYFTGYMWDTAEQKSAITEALKIAKEYKVKVAFDIADPLAVGRNREQFFEIVKENADIVFANSEEARILFDNYDPYECCKSMGKLCETAVVKNGKHGSFVSHKKEILKIAAQGPDKAIDTTGAGDVYAAGFLFGMAKNLGVQSAGFIASYLAGEIIQQRGAQFSKERALEIGTFLKEKFNLK
jgi:sugar/nucleoside kinase (ribokinase family)